jgi:hypothetical protein
MWVFGKVRIGFIKKSIVVSGHSGPVMVALLTYLIPKSSILTSLTLDWLDLSLQDAMQVMRLIPACRSFWTLHFNEIVLREEVLRRPL